MKKSYSLFSLLIVFSSIIILPACEPPVVINDFQAAPEIINKGQSSTLQWDASGVTRVTLNNGIGEVVPSGKAIVTPSVTTKYVLTAGKDAQKQTRSVTVTVNTESDTSKQGLPTTPSASASQDSAVKWVAASIRYDNLNTESDSYLTNQIAVWHTYAKMAGSSSTASAGYSNSARGGVSTLGSAGTAVKSPLIILPYGQGMVCIIKNYSQISYKYFNLVTSWYGDSLEEAERLAQPGYGLATVFSPERKPFKIQKINIAAAANHTGPDEEYKSYHCLIRILDEKNKTVWSKSLPWSEFKSNETTDIPRAMWKSIAVDNVIVNGDFTVEVMAESNDFVTGRAKSFQYLAVAYERVADKDTATRSYISEDGLKSDSWIRLYDDYGHPLGFNLCIRAEGSYQEK